MIEAVRSSVDLGSTPCRALTSPGCCAAVWSRRPPTAREVAGLAAAVGTNFTLDLLTEASDLEADAVVGAVDELWRRRIMHEFRDGYDFSHDLLREAAYAQVSPPKRWLLHRRVAQGLELLHADDTDVVSAQLAEQYARGGRPGQAVAYYRRAADVAAGMFAHAEAIRLHREALSIVRSLPAGRDRDSRELGILEAMAAPLTARYGYSSPELQRTLETLDTSSPNRSAARIRRSAGLVGLVDIAVRPGPHGRRLPGRHPSAEPGRAPGSELSGPAHFAVGGSAVSLGMPAEALRHFELAAKLTSGAARWTSAPGPTCTPWPGPRTPTGCSATRRGAVGLLRTPSSWPGRSTTRTAWRWPWPTARSPTRCARICRAAEYAVDELRELCERYDFAYYREWALILDGWSRAGRVGLEPRAAGGRQPEGGRARSPACRTGCRCLPTCWPGTAGLATPGRRSMPRSRPGRPETTCGGCPR